MSTLYVGIDIAKRGHVAALLSRPILDQYKSFARCPIVKIENTRHGFTKLLTTLRSHGPLSDVRVLLERTGHYGLALEQFLAECGISVYRIQRGSAIAARSRLTPLTVVRWPACSTTIWNCTLNFLTRCNVLAHFCPHRSRCAVFVAWSSTAPN